MKDGLAELALFEVSEPLVKEAVIEKSANPFHALTRGAKEVGKNIWGLVPGTAGFTDDVIHGTMALGAGSAGAGLGALAGMDKGEMLAGMAGGATAGTSAVGIAYLLKHLLRKKVPALSFLQRRAVAWPAGIVGGAMAGKGVQGALSGRAEHPTNKDFMEALYNLQNQQ